jgi:hypothetical protein
LGIFTETSFQANNIGILFVHQLLDEQRPEIMCEGLTSRLYDSVEESAKLILNEIGHIFFVIQNVILDNPRKYNAQGTLIVEAFHILDLSIMKINISARRVHFFHSEHNLLIQLGPVLGQSQTHNLAEQL